MALYKRGKIWWCELMIEGRRYRDSTGMTNKEDARQYENGLRKELRLGNIGILKAGPAPLLKDFLKHDFDPFVTVEHKEKPNTLDYYKYGSIKLQGSKIGKQPIDEICGANIAEFKLEHEKLSASGMNQSLRTLRRALNLAFEWGKLQRKTVIKLAPGERMRDRVITPDEESKYLEACTEPWRTMATIIVNQDLRPGEVFQLKVDDADLERFVIHVRSGKSKAAKRDLPMVDAVYLALKRWLDQISWPKSGWLFPSPDPERKGKPYGQQRVFDWHHGALERSGVESFEPYCLRHTALTRLAKSCRNPYAVAKAAGHSTIAMTYRYVHPEEEEIRAAYEAMSGNRIGNAARRDILKVVGIKEEPQDPHNITTATSADQISNGVSGNRE